MRVYHLTEALFGLSDISLRRLKVARFSELNDPFELLAVNVANFDLRAGISAKKRQIDKKEGLLCFSRAWRDPLLWAHYGEQHRGLCLGFDVAMKHLKSVRYVKGLRKIDVVSPSTTQATVDRFLTRLRYTKFDGWKYENEVRQLVSLRSLKPQLGLYFLPFSKDLVLREVILGSRCNLPIDSIKRLVKSYTPSVRVLRSRIAFSRFAVIED